MVILFSLVKKGKKACKFEQIFKIVPLIFLAVLINEIEMFIKFGTYIKSFQ